MNKRQIELAKEKFGGIAVCDDIACRGCIFAYPDDPQNGYCKIYKRGETGSKPHRVYFFGEICEYRATEADLDEAEPEKL